MNFYMNIDNVNDADIDALNEWCGKLANIFRKYNFAQALFGELLGEVTQEVVLDWTSGTSIDTMIEDVLHDAAKKMPHFTEDHWAVTSFLRAQAKPARHLTHNQGRSLSMWLGVSNSHHGCHLVAGGGEFEFAPFVVS
jgi:hypothetical protein